MSEASEPAHSACGDTVSRTTCQVSPASSERQTPAPFQSPPLPAHSVPVSGSPTTWLTGQPSQNGALRPGHRDRPWRRSESRPWRLRPSELDGRRASQATSAERNEGSSRSDSPTALRCDIALVSVGFTERLIACVPEQPLTSALCRKEKSSGLSGRKAADRRRPIGGCGAGCGWVTINT